MSTVSWLTQIATEDMVYTIRKASNAHAGRLFPLRASRVVNDVMFRASRS